MIKFRCEACFQKHAVPDNFLGRTVRCKCGGVMVVPASQAFFDAEEPAGDDDDLQSVPDLTPVAVADAEPAPRIDDDTPWIGPSPDARLIRRAIRWVVAIVIALTLAWLAFAAADRFWPSP